jgi:hypothetical protein
MALLFPSFLAISDLLQVLYLSLPEFIMSFRKYSTAFTGSDPALSKELYRGLPAMTLRSPRYSGLIY